MTGADPMAAMADAAAELRGERIGQLGEEATLWLAAAPLWTVQAATTAGFPAESVTEFVDRAEAAGWCQTRGSRHAADRMRFWMPEETRREVIETLAARRGPDAVEQEARKIAGRLRKVSEPVPPTLASWVELMTAAAPDQALVALTRRASDAGELGAAQSLVSAGEAMAPVLERTAELAVNRARRMANLVARRDQDERALVRYLDRLELTDAVDALLQPGTDRWALHLRGVGGVGKTMLVRDLASGNYLRRRGRPPVPVARADFDHISADYPVRRPAELLVELADELQLHTAASTGADRALAAFRSAATSVHELLSDARDDSVLTLDHPYVRRTLDSFAQAIERIPRPDGLPPVLLVLDTCEELAKADPGNPAPAAVVATLRIIEELHARVDAVRVLLCGRRPLPVRDYLAVRTVGGFSLPEARLYLTLFAHPPLVPELAEAMIRQSPAADGPTPAAGALPDRVSPFDLALHLDWADAEPGLTPERVAGAGPDAYVEVRILERLRDPALRAALPYLALLGRCRRSTLAEVLGGDDGLLARIAEQEWVDADRDVLTVRPALADRLVRYFSRPDRRAERDAAAATLSAALEARIRPAPLAEVDVDELLVALRLLPALRAARLWDRLVRRAEQPPGRWGWIDNVARRVLGSAQEEHWDNGPALAATVTAAYAAARRHADPGAHVRGLWSEVLATAADHPNPEAARVLRDRAILALLPETSIADLGTVAGTGIGLVPAAVDAADRLLESGDTAAAAALTAHPYFRSGLTGRAGRRVRAWATAVDARLRGDGSALADAEAELDAASVPPDVPAESAEVGAADGARLGDDEPAWADWVPPADLLARIRIELGLLARGHQDAVDALPLPYWLVWAAADLSTVDRERLMSLCLMLRLDAAPIDRAELDRWSDGVGYRPGRQPTASAHDLVPPLFVTVALAEVAAGRPDRALALIEKHRTAALATRDDDNTLRAADNATVRITRRLRLTGQRSLLARLSTSDEVPDTTLRNAARRALAVVHGEPPADGPPAQPASWHAWWQSHPRGALPRKPTPPSLPDSEEAGGLGYNLLLDVQEAQALGLSMRSHSLSGRIGWPRPGRSVDWWNLRALLRSAALLPDEAVAQPLDAPSRLVAEVAFEEAELLDLRLPAPAGALFAEAAGRYRQADDPLGELLALLGGSGDDRPARVEVEAALDRLRDHHPDVADQLSGSAEPGPWAAWAGRLREAREGGVGPAPTPTMVEAPAGDPLRPVTGLLTSAIGAGLGTGAVVAAVSFLRPAQSVVAYAVLGGIVAALVGVGVEFAVPLVRGRAIGHRLAPRSLVLHAAVGPDAQLRTGLVPLRTVGWRRRIPLAALAVLVGYLQALATLWRQYRRFQVGYRSASGENLAWRPPPAARRGWWARGCPQGTLALHAPDQAAAWERRIARSLGPGAAGRIDWIRAQHTTVAPRSAAGRGVDPIAPKAWTAELRRAYQDAPPGDPVAVRHVIGRAVTTASGTMLDLAGDAGEPRLVGVPELVAGSAPARPGSPPAAGPTLVVLQAEPTDVAVDAALTDDAPEKRTLAADLIVAGVPAVLVLPALELPKSTIVWTHVARFARARPTRALLADCWVRLRADLRPYVAEDVLDDLVLIVNEDWDG